MRLAGYPAAVVLLSAILLYCSLVSASMVDSDSTAPRKTTAVRVYGFMNIIMEFRSCMSNPCRKMCHYLAPKCILKGPRWVRGCRCKSGYSLNARNRCIKSALCSCRSRDGKIRAAGDVWVGASCRRRKFINNAIVDFGAVTCKNVCPCKTGTIMIIKNCCPSCVAETTTTAPATTATTPITTETTTTAPKETDSKCGENEDYRICGPYTCTKCHHLDPTCKPDGRCLKGCFCKNGYARNDANQCIKKTRCSCKSSDGKIRAAGAVWIKNCTRYQCENNAIVNLGACQNVICEARTKMTTKECCPSCVSKTTTTTAIPTETTTTAPKETESDDKENKEFSNCGRLCVKKCHYLEAPCVSDTKCYKGWFCKPGYYQSAAGKCIEPAKCSCRSSEGEIRPAGAVWIENCTRYKCENNAIVNLGACQNVSCDAGTKMTTKECCPSCEA